MRKLQLTWIFRVMAIALLPGQFSYGMPVGPVEKAGVAPSPKPERKPNRTQPRVEPPRAEPSFSANPTDAEIFRARVFDEPLVPMPSELSPQDNSALAEAIRRYLHRSESDDTSAVEAFLKHNEHSRWRASLLTDLGLVYRRTGYFTKALSAWQEAWTLSKDVTEPNGRAIADRAVAELAQLTSRLGRFQDLELLLAEVEGRDVRGAATERLQGAREGLWLMQNRPEIAFRCGPLGLQRILTATRPGFVTDPLLETAHSTQRGTSLAQMLELASSLGLDLKMAKREADAPFPVPALVHWRAGHFAAIVAERDGRYLVQDPTFGDDLWVTPRALREEASGYALISQNSFSDGWRHIDSAEGETVWGKGAANNVDLQRQGEPGLKNPGCKGMAVYDVHAATVSLKIMDAPMSYTPAFGPSITLKLTYNQRETFQPQVFYYSNVGPKWTFDWLSYVEDDPGNPGGAVTVYRPGGGQESFSSYTPATQSYAAHYRSYATLHLISTSPIRYERRLNNGSTLVFAQPDGAGTSPRKVFLTEIVDSQGRKLTLTYDAQLRLVSVTDASGLVTTLDYSLTSDPLKITRVTDPFGRSALLEYNAIGQLESVTDTSGIESSFTYLTGDAVKTLTTPYGTTVFNFGISSFMRWIEITDPLGGTERVELSQNQVPSIRTEPASEVPTGFSAYNQALDYPVTLYWDKLTMARYPRDRTKARQMHFLRMAGNLATLSDILHSEKVLPDRRIWYSYPGSNGLQAGPVTLPSSVARVLGDGTSQVTSYEYNAAGLKIREIDPVGRETVYVYGTNNVPDPNPATGTGQDLLEVRRRNGAAWDVMASNSYDANHQILTSTDGAGQPTTYTYRTDGQIETVTTPPRAGISEDRTTTYTYEVGTGHLQTIAAPGGVTTGYTYDVEGRVITTTDNDGYTLTYDYDDLDRLIKTTYPDGTYEETVYEGLDPVRRRDRLGRWSQTFYDTVRRVVATRDPQGRVVTQEWCGCGSLDKLTDPNGNATTWERDDAGRVIKETRANPTIFKTFEYDSTGRLKKVVDAKDQEIQYTYGIDDKLLGTSYVNAEHPTPNVTFSYTDPGTSAPDAHGRLRNMLDGTGTTIYSYKPFGVLGAGQVASVDGPFSNDTIAYSYDELGRVVSRTLNGVNTMWQYDALGRLTTLGDPIGNFNYGYVGSTGRVSSVTYPNGQTTSYAYLPVNQDLRLQEIHHKKPGGVTLNKFNYTYDVVGNIQTWAQQTDTNPAQTYTFEYDRADQLTAATLAAATPRRYRYAYDLAGNRTLEQVDDTVTLSTHDNMNRLITQVPTGAAVFKGTLSEPAIVTVGGNPASVSGANQFVGTAPPASPVPPNDYIEVLVQARDYSPNQNTRTNTYRIPVTGSAKGFTYDPNGNLIADGTNTYTWDAANRLVEVKQGTTTLASFTYDGEGRRTTKTAGGATTSYAYDGDNFLEERSGSGSTTRYAYAGLDQPLAQVVGGTITYNLADHLGSVVRTNDVAGNPTLTRQYDPWGNLLQGSVTSGYAFTGREWDAETSLYYYRARHYDPNTARFSSEDPLPASLVQLYVYAHNNPLSFTDPSGLKPGDTFWTEEDAVIDTLQWIADHKYEYKWDGWEWGGNVCKDTDGCFSCTAPVTDRLRTEVDTRKSPCSSGTEQVAWYHTHTVDSGPGFSPDDRNWSRLYGPGYALQTVDGKVLKYVWAKGKTNYQVIGYVKMPK